ncbi:2-hydroxyacyl-CoA dehydratase family protein [Cryptosporangium aurantiacum]|uniref:Benzoyl-CoA reductase/2-hydroxyglutaryl-CoA dehydratase subunit, BcrC/BadD/HgdB n=1 Tax=Cryptosporangium aurantiacum TaxID=134849 RepID=A0A1M7TVW9_9ACTN|nr:2-hydroxyacyl-CoA dehydratase family protein [Cryptosporangium aurantiacum]SHN74868.1 Benzoyl-CoA reductase/2-hydroxyglutaryl-CoA dehydratase subunit, BcrC/BadD/HgdB [Cryptosporangium aurantiacum]
MTERLPSALAATQYQRRWFAELRASGVPIALVNADAPQEIFRAMEIPYVVSQWWASIVAAKQRTADHLALLAARGYPDHTEQYSSLSFASSFGVDDPPWGGLPTPSVLLGEATGDVTRKIFEAWHEETGVPYYALESAAHDPVPERWWELMPHDWEHTIGTPRLDLMQEELVGLIRFLEMHTGRRFSETRFRRVMDLANEQAEWNRRTRDLIASARPCPVAVTDIVPSVMVPQWHRGTEWARDAARTLYEEVAQRVGAGRGAGAERARLMWIGRGLWFDLGFYRRFEERYGAVFVWSMYLAIAADGYARYGPDPLRALAARFAAFTDQLYTPPWSVEWYVHQARTHGVDGVVHLVSEDGRGSWFTTSALRAAGIPVLELRADNVDSRGYDPDAAERTVGAWLTEQVTG